MKTKHLFLTAILLVFSMLVVAAPVDPMRALEVAEQFAPQPAKGKGIKSKTAPEQSYEIVYTHRMPNSDRAAFYVVKLGEKGFVIISADDVANPILGYSYTNSWPTSISAEGDTILPLQVLSYLNDMALQIETAIEKYPNLDSSEEWNNVGQKTVRKSRTRKSADALPDSVGPLLTTTWGQGQYYNALCPEDANGEDGHVPTGCVATAMAQIIHYWGQKEEIKTRGIHSYDSQYGNLTVNYDSTSYDFANMPDVLTAESTPEQINAVAKLMYECGVAVNMLYNTGASASLNEDARAALINFYHFTPDLSIAERAYFSSVEWDNLLHNDIAQGKPVYYSGAQNNLGHSFVCDGYNATGYYHFNFGWGGLADGWYLTSAVSPVGMDFNSNQLVLVGIVPNNMSNVILGQTTGNSVFKVEEPFEFYHLLGHNAYEGTNYINECNNHVLFKSADNATQLVLDIIEHEDQNATIYDGEGGTELRSLYAGQENDLSPIVSTNNALHINYSGYLYYSGFHFAISRDEGCRRVSNIVTSVDTTTVHLMWQENGNATQWEIEYGEKGFALGSGTRIVTESTRYDIIGLKKFTEYDIYIRSVCSANDYGEWNKVSILSEAPYWTDVVTEQPEGYIEDAEGNITISSAEGLAWFAKLADSKWFAGKYVSLMSDINLGEYKWKPIMIYDGDDMIFDGNGHIIEDLIIIEHNIDRNGDVGFFGDANYCIIKNLCLKSIHIESGLSAYTGGIVAFSRGSSIINCQVQGVISGGYISGGIIGVGQQVKIYNSSTNCDIQSENPGGIASHLSQGYLLKNCYSNCTIRNIGTWVGGLISQSYDGGVMHNCYFSDNVRVAIGYFDIPIDTLNIIPFDFIETTPTLKTPAVFENEEYTDLVDALNKGVECINTADLKEWIYNTDSTYGEIPILGEKYIVSCTNTSMPRLRNIAQGDSIGVVISWEEYGDATLWQIRYRVRDSINYTIHTTNHNPDTIWNLQFGECYNFNIRPICDDLHRGAWTDNVIHTVTTPYWTEMVTSKPEGFIIDSIGNIIISSAEGLAWLASVVNGLNGEKANKLENQTVYLKVDVDMSKLRWAAIDGFQGKFDGGGHMIYGITIDEQSSNQGFFGSIESAQIINVDMVDINISALNNVGGLCGHAHNSIIDNCSVSGTVYGIDNIGNLIGRLTNGTVNHCFVRGITIALNDQAGGLIGEFRTLVDESSSSMINCYIRNCSSSCRVTANNVCAGGLLGAVYAEIEDNITIENSFAQNSVSGFAYVGGLIGAVTGFYSQTVTIRNCCSYSNVNADPHIANSTYPDEHINGALIGQCIGNVIISKCYVKEQPLFSFIGSHHGTQDRFSMKDTSFITNDGVTSQLNTPVTINGIAHNNSVSALNEWINLIADDSYYTWKDDTSEEYAGWPIFGELYNKNCPSVTSLQVDSIWNNGVKLKWHNDNDVNTWKIEYGLSGFERGEGCVIYVSDTIITVDSLTTGDYYDFYIQSCCNECLLGKSDSITLKPDKKYWVDIVTSKPNGYEEDTNGNIYISSPEGLAWLISTCNGINNETQNSFYKKTIFLLNDIDISDYQWTPIEYFEGTFNGLNHKITGLYINNNTDNNAMFNRLTRSSSVRNLMICDGKLRGRYNIAGVCLDNYGLIENCGIYCNIRSVKFSGIIAWSNWGSIINSYCNGEIEGTDYVGGAIGWNFGIITNCYVSSTIKSSMLAHQDNAGVNIGQFTVEELTNHEQSCAYWLRSLYNINNGITATNGHSTGYYGFDSSDTSWKLLSSQWINGKLCLTLLDALNAWVDENNTESQYRHWVADTAGVNGGFPIFAEEDTKYVIIFCNDDGTILQQDTLEFGEMPEYRGKIPTKDSTEQYNYTFIGWNQELVPVTKDVTYYAQYESTLNQYNINFYNWDGTLLQSSMVNYGEWPTYYNFDPWRESDAQYTYTFLGWSPQLDWVTGAANYYAQYEATLNQYEINFYDWDGTLLQSTMVNYGEWPTYYNSDPWREADAQYTYTFNGWSPQLDWVTGHQSYYAQYESTLNQYEINFYDWNGTLLQSSMVNYGEWPMYYNSDPWREADAQYTYTFTGWSPQLDWVSGNQAYYAQYEATLNQYEVTFYNWNGEVLQSTMVDYGAMPEYFGVTPTKPEDDQYVYTFSGWEPEITIVVAYAEYTAQYDATDKVTTVIENTQSDEVKTYKILRNNKIFIIRGDKVYSILGHVIED